MGKRLILIGILAWCILPAAGCDYVGFYTRQSTWHAAFESQPRLSALKRFAPEHSLLLNGKIVNIEEQRGPLLLAAVSSQYRDNEIVALTTIRDPFGHYTVFLPKGDYALFVFADLNSNGLFERDELVGSGLSVMVDVTLMKEDGVLDGPTIAIDYTQPGKTVFRIRAKVQVASYVYSSLEDEFFDPEFGSKGLYNPADLMAHTQGFIFGLEDYDENKTMVLFVHGIGGTPRDWKYFAEGLDRSRFQPFFLYYPSGMPLDKLGSLLAQEIDSLDKSSGKGRGRRRIVLAAHSMGGLVAMSAINKLAAEKLPSSLKMYCSFSTPYGGDEAARKGVENAPVVVPVWRDIATGSEFLQKLTAQQFPKSLPFYLFFSYNDPSTFKLGETSDGVVSLRSQLTPWVQKSALKIWGFNQSHTGFFTSEEARQEFLRLLDKVTPPKNMGGKEQ